MGNSISDDEDDQDVVRKAIIPFRVRNNGFQVDYKIFKFNTFTKAKIDEATDTKYDDTFLELNTRSKIVGDIRKILTIRAETISEEYASLRRNYYSRIFFGIVTFIIGIVLTNIGLIQNQLPKGRIMIIFGGLLLILCIITFIIVVYTDRRLKLLNKEFVAECVTILEKEKIVTWTASFQHLLFDIIFPYNYKSGTGAVILTPNPYFEMINATTDIPIDKDIKINNPNDPTNKLKLPIPDWAIEQSVSNENENAPLIYNKHKNQFSKLILPPSDHDIDDDDHKSNPLLLNIISANEQSDTDNSSSGSMDDHSHNSNNNNAQQQSDDDADNEEEDDLDILNKDDNNPLIPSVGDKGVKDKYQAPKAIKAYTGIDYENPINAKKIHGDLMQRYFHDNPEDIEGHGEDTALQQLVANNQLKLGKKDVI